MEEEKTRLGSGIQLLQEYFPLLMDGIVCSAFHPLILIGYAFEMDQIEEDLIVDGISYLCFAYQSIGIIQDSFTQVQSPEDLLKQASLEEIRS
jgi:hypothetical protein